MEPISNPGTAMSDSLMPEHCHGAWRSLVIVKEGILSFEVDVSSALSSEGVASLG